MNVLYLQMNYTRTWTFSIYRWILPTYERSLSTDELYPHMNVLYLHNEFYPHMNVLCVQMNYTRTWTFSIYRWIIPAHERSIYIDELYRHMNFLYLHNELYPHMNVLYLQMNYTCTWTFSIYIMNYTRTWTFSICRWIIPAHERSLST